MTRSRAWIVASLFALASFSIPFLVITVFADRDPEIRLIQTGNHVSALIIDGNSRILTIHSSDRRHARSAIGRLARPWEPDASMVIAPASEQATPGLWEAFGHPAVRQIIIAGLPGSDPVWSSLENEARRRDIELTYAGEPVKLSSRNLQIEIHPGNNPEQAFIRITRGDTVSIVALGSSIPHDSAHALAAVRIPDDVARFSLVIAPASNTEEVVAGTLLMGGDAIVTLVLEEERIRVQGGRHIREEEPAN